MPLRVAGIGPAGLLNCRPQRPAIISAKGGGGHAGRGVEPNNRLQGSDMMVRKRPLLAVAAATALTFMALATSSADEEFWAA